MGEPTKKKNPTIRIRPEDLDVLQRVCEELGSPQIAVLAWMVEALSDYHARHRKRIMLPLRFDETFVVYQIVLPSTPTEKVLVVKQRPANASKTPKKEKSQ